VPTYEVTYQATVVVEAANAALAVEAIPSHLIQWEITVDGNEFNPATPPGCSALTFPGTRIDREEFCENDVVRWDEHGYAWCDIHGAQPNDGEGL